MNQPATQSFTASANAAQQSAQLNFSAENMGSSVMPNVPSRLGPLDWVGTNFDYTQGWTYFAALRQLGYTFETLYTTLMLGFAGISRDEANVGSKDNTIINQKLPEASREAIRKSVQLARGRTNLLEGATFSGLALGSTALNMRSMKTHFKDAVAAEFGKEPDQITTLDIRQSTNPLVRSAMDYNVLRAMSRLGTSLPFFMPLDIRSRAFGSSAYAGRNTLIIGILSKTVDILLERTVFRQQTAVQELDKLVQKVERNQLGDMANNSTARALVEIFQQSRREFKQPSAPKDQVKEWMPGFNALAVALNEGVIGVNEIVYAMGNTFVWGDGEQSLRNVEHLIEVGLQGISAEVKAAQKIHQDAIANDKPTPEFRLHERKALVKHKPKNHIEGIIEQQRLQPEQKMQLH